eukprot:snap_masked-scaffold_2-processed-gene-22.1-mRNA-1 protein AED:1.00 eAED:1.00 QI:0/0/0/0/1/1/2/0/1280
MITIKIAVLGQVVSSRRLGVTLSTRFQSVPLDSTHMLQTKAKMQNHLGSSADFDCVKFLDFEESTKELILEAASSDHVNEVFLGILNEDLELFSSGTSDKITEFVDLVNEIQPLVSQVHVAVGHEPFREGISGSIVTSAIDTFRNRLAGFPVSIPFSFDVLDESKNFTSTFLDEYREAINRIDFFTINLYPHLYASDIAVEDIVSIDMLPLTQALTDLRAALDAEFAYRSNFQIVIGETGFPSGGDDAATEELSFRYLSNLVSWMEDSTSAAGLVARMFVFELVDEDLSDGLTENRFLGVFNASGLPKLESGGNGTETPSLSNRRVGINLSTKFQKSPLSIEEVYSAAERLQGYLELDEQVECVKFFDFDSTVAELIAGAVESTQFKEIMLGIPNYQLPDFEALWFPELKTVLETYQDDVSFTIQVSNEPYINSVTVSDLETTLSVLKANFPSIPVSVPFSYGIMGPSYPVEDGAFLDAFVSSYTSVLSSLDFLTINLYPFFTLGVDVSVETALSPTIFTNQLLAFQFAVARDFQELSHLEIVVGETGWPSAGSSAATVSNGYEYFQTMSQLIEDSGLSGELLSRGYLFELFDEELKTGSDNEPNFGIFYSSGGTKFPEDDIILSPTAEATSGPATNLSQRRVGINLSTKFQSSPLSVEAVYDAAERLQQYLNLDEQIECVKFFDFDSTVAELIAGAVESTQFKEIMLGIPNYQLPDFEALWFPELKTVLETYQDDVIFTIQVSNEPYINSVTVSDLETTLSVLKANFPSIPVSVPFSYGIMGPSYPVEDGAFLDAFVSSYTSVLSSLDFLTINVYPFFTLGVDVSVETALSPTIFTNQLLAFQFAVARDFQELSHLEIVVGETGWPSAGSSAATVSNGYEYFQTMSQQIEDSGLSGELLSRGYLFELFDEELKTGSDNEPNFGIFYGNGQSKFTESNTSSATTLTSRRVGINLSTKFQENALSVADVFEATRKLEEYLGLEEQIECVKFFDFDSSVSSLIAGAASSGQFKEIMLGVPNVQLVNFETQFITEFFNVIQTYKDTVNLTIQVSNEPFFNNVNVADLEETVTLLKENFPNISVSVPFSYAIMAESFPVSSGAFQTSFSENYGGVLSLVDFITINVYPFFALGEFVSAELALSEELFTNQVLAFQAALAKDFPELRSLPIVIGETGWPSSGSAEATIDNGFEYFHTISKYIEEGDRSGTLLSRGYLFEMFDEELKDGAATEPNFGIFFSNGTEKITQPTDKPTDDPVNEGVAASYEIQRGLVASLMLLALHELL